MTRCMTDDCHHRHGEGRKDRRQSHCEIVDDGARATGVDRGRVELCRAIEDEFPRWNELSPQRGGRWLVQ
jgi:coenzyme F420-reducing hydrogenase delta subunit